MWKILSLLILKVVRKLVETDQDAWEDLTRRLVPISHELVTHTMGDQAAT